jgi:lysophospholipase L1-like esterase
MERYEEDLKNVLTKMQRAHPTSACILVGPSDRGIEDRTNRYSIWERTQMVADVQRSVAPDFGCVFWDWQQATGGIGSMIAWKYTKPRLASQDLIHFTGKGYQVSADQFLLALDDAASNFQNTSSSERFRFWKK